jgi:hypothetical protein
VVSRGLSAPAVDPKNKAATKVVLSAMKTPNSPKDSLYFLGTDYLAEQRNEFLKGKPAKGAPRF